MTAARGLLWAAVTLVAAVVQVSFFAAFAWDGVVPNLVLLVVVAAGLTRDSTFAAGLGFFGGLCLDLILPTEALLGQWALALVLVGWLTGQVRSASQRSTVLALATVGLGSLVGMSTYTLLGLLTQTIQVSVVDALQVIGTAMLFDLLLAPFVIPGLLRMFRQLRPATRSYAVAGA